jgi:O-antigen/teichoic acid export membrane protein
MRQMDEHQAREVSRRTAEWDIRFGPKNFFGLIGTQFASSVLAFGTVWVATRLLGAEGYGRIVAILTAVQLASQLTVNWTLSSVARYGCEEFVESGSIAKSFWTRLAILVPNSLLVLITIKFWLPPVATWLRITQDLYSMIVLVFVASVLWLHLQQSLQAAKLPRWQGQLLTLERALILIILIALFLSGKSSVRTVSAAYVFSPLIATTVALYRLRNLITPWFSFDVGLLKSIFRFSFPLIPYSVIGYFTSSYLDAFFISRFLSTEALGVYSVAVQVSGTMLQPVMLAGSLLMPLFLTLESGDRGALVVRFFKEILPLATLGWSGLCVAIAAVCSLLLPIVFGPQFERSAIVVWPLLASGAVAAPLLLGYAPITSVRALTYLGSICAVIAATINVVLDYLLIPRFGLAGSAWATLAAYGAHTLVAAWLIHRRIPEIRNFAPLASLPAVLGAATFFISKSPLIAVITAALPIIIYVIARRREIASSAAAVMSMRASLATNS